MTGSPREAPLAPPGYKVYHYTTSSRGKTMSMSMMRVATMHVKVMTGHGSQKEGRNNLQQGNVNKAIMTICQKYSTITSQ